MRQYSIQAGQRMVHLRIIAFLAADPNPNTHDSLWHVLCDCGWEGALTRSKVIEQARCGECYRLHRETIRAARIARVAPAPGTRSRFLFDLIISSRRPAPDGINHGIIIKEALEIVRLAERSNTVEDEIRTFSQRFRLGAPARGSAASMCIARGEA